MRNGYTIKVVNKQRSHRTFHVHIEGLPGAVVEIIGEGGDASSPVVSASADSVERYRLLLTAGPTALNQSSLNIRVVLSEAGRNVAATAATFLKPEEADAS